MINKLIKLLFLLLAVLLLTACQVAFAHDGRDGEVGAEAAQTEVAQSSLLHTSSAVNNIEYRDVIHYVDRDVIKEVMVEKPIEWCEFTSLAELKTWLAEDNTDKYVYLFAGEDGVARQSHEYDCDDYAIQLQRRAAESGFLMSVTIIEKKGRPHMINLVLIGNDIYYIEPQTDEVWFYCHWFIISMWQHNVL